MEQTTFTDSDGALWTVREDGIDEGRSVSSDVPQGTAWLRFESELEVRRLWHYPDDWRGLSPLQLESLLDRASTVVARFRPARHREADAAPSRERDVSEPADLRATRSHAKGVPKNRPGSGER